MRFRTLMGCIATLVAAGCASTGAVDARGWSGEGAEPFDGARAACEADAAAMPAGEARRVAFETCMARKGWHRR